MLIDWVRLTTDVAGALYERKRITRGIWQNLSAHADFSGVRVPPDSARQWARGRTKPKGDAALWLYLKAEELSVSSASR